MAQGSRVTERGLLNKKLNRMGKDFISTMLDEIVIIILSMLTIKEAGRTCILSTRWRNLWTFFYGVLTFDHSLKTLQMNRQQIPLLRNCTNFVSEWESFMGSLEHVLTSLKTPSLQGLRICMDLGNPARLADCIKFVAKKNVKMLDLDFSYHFLGPFFGISCNLRNVLSATSVQMRSLCVLRLSSVDVSGEVIEYFLASCPLLETLFVKQSLLFTNLRVWGQGLRLKHLELVQCITQYFHICAENLITFRYSGGYRIFDLDYMPRLQEASFDGVSSSYYVQEHMDDIKLFRILSKIRVLKLELRVHDLSFLQGLPQFWNVKHLELLIPHGCGTQLDRPVSLLGAFPAISVLKLKFQRYNMRPPQEEQWESPLNHELPDLRELEVSGYKRDPSQIELLTSIFENAPNLKKIVVDPLSAVYRYRSDDVKAWIRERCHDTTIWFVDGLKPYVPPSVEVIVL